MTKTEKLGIACLVLIAGFFASVAFHYWQGSYNGLGYPYNTFLYAPADDYKGMPFDLAHVTQRHIFGDLYSPWVQSQERNPYQVTGNNPYPSNYFPFAHTVMLPLSFFNFTTAVYLFLLLSCVGLFLFNFKIAAVGERWGDLRNAFVLTFFSYPVLFVFDRGNIESFVFLFCGFAILLFQTGKHYWAAFLIGCAAAMKGYPVLFLVPFLVEKKYRAALMAVVTAGILTLASFLWFKGGVIENVQALWAAFNHYYQVGFLGPDHTAQHSSNLYALLVVLDHYLQGLAFQRWVIRFLILNYNTIQWLLAGLFAVCLIRSKRLLFWERLALVVSAILFLPLLSYDYKLLLFMLPFASFLNSKSETRKESIYFVLIFSLLLVPKGFIVVRAGIHIASMLNPLLILALIIPIMGKALASRSKTVADVELLDTPGF